MLYILTYCTEKSYGSVLQAYGLKTTLQSLGFESKILIQGQPPRASYTLSSAHNRTLRGNIRYLSRRLSYKKRNRRFQGTQSFIEKHLDVVYCERISGDMFSDNDIFLSGSDQVWNPLAMKPEFFLEFAPQHATKITYAVSMGVSAVPEDKKTGKKSYGVVVFNWKHPDDVIRVAPKLKDSAYSFELNMIGTGAMENELCQMIREYDLVDCVNLLGTMSPEQVREHMEHAGIYLLVTGKKAGEPY